MKRYSVATVHGDGIGPEVCAAAIEVVSAALDGRRTIDFIDYPAGAELYRRTGVAVPAETFEGCRRADAILHGAAGLPEVTYPDGTEAGLDFTLNLRTELQLYANVRPIRLYDGVVSPLARARAGGIDYVIVRENSEGLYAARGAGSLLRDEVAVDTLVQTRKGIERVTRMAFEIARRRNGAPADGVRRVTLCDKANVLRSYAFFRRVFTEIAAEYPDIEHEYALVDAMTVYLINRPDHYDVIVTENMFGDILSDLGAATVGGMGMAPSAELGAEHGFFQAAHGSAPDIAGRGVANPYGTILAAASMLDWLGERHQDRELVAAARRMEGAVARTLSGGRTLTRDIGGTASTAEAVRAVCGSLVDA